jgi:hypothetical protein
MKRMNFARASFVVLVVAALVVIVAGCAEQVQPYGLERQVTYQSPQRRREVWAVAPALNLSGYRDVDPLLQADLVYGQLQQVNGITVIPVNRVVEVYATLKIDQVQSPEQAIVVCDLLGCDALVVPTVTAYDPYVPPKFGASLQLLGKPTDYARPASVDPRDLARQATPTKSESLAAANAANAKPGAAVQAVGMFDAANGSVREALFTYATGRNDPVGPMGPREYLVSMDRYCGFVYHELILDVISRASRRKA